MRLNPTIRLLEPKDNQSLKELIPAVLKQFGASGDGYASADPELDDMYSAYSKPGFLYWVIEAENTVLGGGGIGYLNHGKGSYCELQKMYFDTKIRGLGLGQQLIETCLKSAVKLGYKFCYLETLPNMIPAINLYKKNGFVKVEKRYGNTGHSKCPYFMLKQLTS